MRKAVILLLAFAFFAIQEFALLTTSVFAEDPTSTPTPTPNESQKAETAKLEQRISEYQKKLDDTRKQRDTLDNQLQYLDTQAYVTSLRIEETENKVKSVKKETEILNDRIDTLDQKLDTQWRLFLATTYASYKKRQASIFDLILNSENAEQMLSSMKYHALAQSNRQRLLIQTQETKINFEEQKSLREEKQKELTKLQDVLAEQKTSLETQKESKKVLISATKNKEAEYQNIIAEAQRQINAFKSFIVSTGTNVIAANGLGTGIGVIVTGKQIGRAHV